MEEISCRKTSLTTRHVKLSKQRNDAVNHAKLRYFTTSSYAKTEPKQQLEDVAEVPEFDQPYHWLTRALSACRLSGCPVYAPRTSDDFFGILLVV